MKPNLPTLDMRLLFQNEGKLPSHDREGRPLYYEDVYWLPICVRCANLWATEFYDTKFDHPNIDLNPKLLKKEEQETECVDCHNPLGGTNEGKN